MPLNLSVGQYSLKLYRKKYGLLQQRNLMHMDERDFSELTDHELLAEAKKMKSAAIMNAFIIGFMVGVVIYGVAKNNIGFFGLIPLYFAFRFFFKKQHNEPLKRALKERKL